MAYRSGRHFLQIPGPTNVPDRILRAISAPTIDHRGPEFAALARQVLADVARLCGTSGPVALYPASGTGAWARRTVGGAGRPGRPYGVAAASCVAVIRDTCCSTPVGLDWKAP